MFRKGFAVLFVDIPELGAVRGRPSCIVEVEAPAHDAARHLQEVEGGRRLRGEQLEEGVRCGEGRVLAVGGKIPAAAAVAEMDLEAPAKSKRGEGGGRRGGGGSVCIF